MKYIKYMLLLLCLFVLISCTNTSTAILQSITVVDMPDKVEIGKFDNAGIRYKMLYDDNTVEYKAVTEEIIPEDYRHYLHEEGTHEFEFRYKGVTVKFKITMYEFKYKIMFVNINGEVVKTEYYQENEKINYPTNDEMYVEGYKFLGTYNKDVNNMKIESDVIVNGNYVKVWKVEFYNGQGKLISSQIVEDGKPATEPSKEDTYMEGYLFEQWSVDFNNITSDLKVYGYYETNHEHKYVKQVTPQTCTNDGYTTYICSCGKTYKDDIKPAIGHRLTDWIVVSEQTCTTDGYKYKECENCKEKLSELRTTATGHTVSDWIVDIKATCTTDGYQHKECDLCGLIIQEATIKAHHKESSWIEVSEQTCTDDGYKYKTCLTCGVKTSEQTLKALGHNFVGFGCTRCSEVEKNSPYTFNEDKTQVTFGSYPQSLVTNSSIKYNLKEKIGKLPTYSNNYNWTSYGYYKDGSNSTNYMWYQDITFNEEKYRAVYFTSYRPTSTVNGSTQEKSHQDNNGYYTSNVYYFKFEPITWKVLKLDNDKNKAFLFANIALDSQSFNNVDESKTVNGETIYANNYEYSTIRQWLNYYFYNTAFNINEKSIILDTVVDNSAESTGVTENIYSCNNTLDKVFLLSYQEATTLEYGFGENYIMDVNRQLKATDYATVQGCYQSTDDEFLGNCYWWLRSAKKMIQNAVYYIEPRGDDFGYMTYSINYTVFGIVPALWISL